MVLIFNLKRKRLYRVFLVPSFMAEARGLSFYFAKSFRSSSLGKFGFAFKEEFTKVLAFLRRRRRRSRILLFKFQLKKIKRLYRVFFDSDIYGGSERIKLLLRKILPFLLTRKIWIRLQGGVHKSACIFETTTQKIENPPF